MKTPTPEKWADEIIDKLACLDKDGEKKFRQGKALLITIIQQRDDYKKHWDEWVAAEPIRVARETETRLERDSYLNTLHQCYTATGADAGDLCDFKALADREKHALKAVKELRLQKDILERDSYLVHSCHDNCQRKGCVNRRKAELLDKLLVALKKQVAAISATR